MNLYVCVLAEGDCLRLEIHDRKLKLKLWNFINSPVKYMLK